MATLITDADLNVVAEGPVIAVKQPDSQLAWQRGLKTTYYLRSLGATGAEKTTPVAAPQPQVCSIDEPDCEACQ